MKTMLEGNSEFVEYQYFIDEPIDPTITEYILWHMTNNMATSSLFVLFWK